MKREFWLLEEHGHIYSEHSLKNHPGIKKLCVHVIEKSAYDALAAELSACKAENALHKQTIGIANKSIVEFETEIADLNQIAQKAIERSRKALSEP